MSKTPNRILIAAIDHALNHVDIRLHQYRAAYKASPTEANALAAELTETDRKALREVRVFIAEHRKEGEEIRADQVKVGDVLERFGRVDKVEVTDDHWVQISYEGNGGNWGDFENHEKLTRLSEAGA